MRQTLFEGFLSQHDQRSWERVVERLSASIHEVDRDATRIWFHFWPMWLLQAVRRAPDVAKLMRQLDLKGDFRLDEQVDTSHTFLYGHRWWPEVKRAVIEHADSENAPESLDLDAQVLAVAKRAAAAAGVDAALLVGITAVAFNTLQQVGLEVFRRGAAEVHLDAWARKRTPARVLRDRAKTDSQGPFGFLKGPLKWEYTVVFDENHRPARFKLINSQEITTASLRDQRRHGDYVSDRCMPGQGPLPTECRSAACGTCWVGILGGNDRVSEVGALEARRMQVFGYIESDEERPLIRLACKTRPSGNVTIVVPPWSAVAGRWLEERRVAYGGASADPDEESVAEPRRH